MVQNLTLLLLLVIVALMLFYPVYSRLIAGIMAKQLDEKDIDVKEMYCNFTYEVEYFIQSDPMLFSVYESAKAHNFSICDTLNNMVVALVREKQNREKQNTVTDPSVE